nr:hypothetical protein [Tanacetum cinerariifolium]
MEEINNFQQELDETLYQAWERLKKLSIRCHQHYLTDMLEVILFYKGLDVPTRQILDSKGVKPSMKSADAKKAIQDMADHSKKWHNGMSARTKSTNTSDRLAAIQAQLNNLIRDIKKRHDENYNLIKEIRAAIDAAIRNQGASIKALEIQIGQLSKVLQERGSGSLPSATETKPRDYVKSISTTVETKTPSIRRIEPMRYTVSSPQQNAVFQAKTIDNSFSSRLISDSYEEKEALESLLMYKPRIRYARGYQSPLDPRKTIIVYCSH